MARDPSYPFPRRYMYQTWREFFREQFFPHFLCWALGHPKGYRQKMYAKICHRCNWVLEYE